MAHLSYHNQPLPGPPSGAISFWQAVREVLDLRAWGLGPQTLVSIISSMSSSGHMGNKEIIDTKLLPALQPYLAAIVEDAAQFQQQQQQQQPIQEQRCDSQSPAVLGPEDLSALLSALARLPLTPRPAWWQLYQDALATSLPLMDVFTLAETLAALAALQLPAPTPWVRLVMKAVPPKRAAMLDPRRKVMMLVGFSHLADTCADDPQVFDARTVASLWAGAQKHLEQLCGSRPAASSESTNSGSSHNHSDGGGSSSGVGSSSNILGSGSSSTRSTGSNRVIDSSTLNSIGLVSFELMRAGGMLQRARLNLGPPDRVVPLLLSGSQHALKEGLLAPAQLGQLARSAAILGVQPGQEWLDRRV